MNAVFPMNDFFTVRKLREIPLVVTAIHDGHEVRDEVARRLALGAEERRREEDPYTGEWTDIGGIQITVARSRFEMDLNRWRKKAVYRRPEDAWNLEVWRKPPTYDLLHHSLVQYDAFYSQVHAVLAELERRHGCFVVYDLHSYNHRRQGAGAPPADPAKNPDIDVGTSNMDEERWKPVVDGFVTTLRRHDFLGRRLDVRKNVKFRGGRFSRWIHETFPQSGCCLAVEVKKFFMDEWTGEPDDDEIEAVREALAATVPAVLGRLRRIEAGAGESF